MITIIITNTITLINYGNQLPKVINYTSLTQNKTTKMNISNKELEMRRRDMLNFNGKPRA